MATRAYRPFDNGRVLPSKWEDAERWIFNPVSTDVLGRSSVLPAFHRRPKSKSGPIGHHGYRPASLGAVHIGRVGSSTSGSPFLPGILVANGCSETTRSSSANKEPLVFRSGSTHACSETLLESISSSPSCQKKRVDCIKRGYTSTTMTVSKRDALTQMSPERSTRSFPKNGDSFLPSLISFNHANEQDSRLPKTDVRDVQIDDQLNLAMRSKKKIEKCSDRHSTTIVEWKGKDVDTKSSCWEVLEAADFQSREEAKISAWENLQKAKAEEEIRKLKMKLEKKRSSSIDKILKKLSSAQKKAEEMRRTLVARQKQQVAVKAMGLYSFSRRRQISSFRGCFSCPF